MEAHHLLQVVFAIDKPIYCAIPSAVFTRVLRVYAFELAVLRSDVCWNRVQTNKVFVYFQRDVPLVTLASWAHFRAFDIRFPFMLAPYTDDHP